MNSSDSIMTGNATDIEKPDEVIISSPVYGYFIFTTIIVFLTGATIFCLGFLVYCCVDLLCLTRLPRDLEIQETRLKKTPSARFEYITSEFVSKSE